MNKKSNENLEVLIVDDDLIMTKLHKNFLVRSNINQKTVTCFNGKQALNYILDKKDFGTSFLVLLDLNMPVMNGIEFLEKSRKKGIFSQIFVVIITSSTYKEDLSNALKYDVVIDYHTKPLQLKDVERIKRLQKVKKFFN